MYTLKSRSSAILVSILRYPQTTFSLKLKTQKRCNRGFQRNRNHLAVLPAYWLLTTSLYSESLIRRRRKSMREKFYNLPSSCWLIILQHKLCQVSAFFHYFRSFVKQFTVSSMSCDC